MSLLQALSVQLIILTMAKLSKSDNHLSLLPHVATVATSDVHLRALFLQEGSDPLPPDSIRCNQPGTERGMFTGNSCLA